MVMIVINLSLLSLLLDVYMKWQKLTDGSFRHIFKPSAVGSHATSSSGRDELCIPDAELKRIHAMGRKHTDTHTQIRENSLLKFIILTQMKNVPTD